MAAAFDPDAFESADNGDDEAWEPSVTVASDDFENDLCFDHSPPNFHDPFPDIEVDEKYEYTVEVEESVEDVEVKESSGQNILGVDVEKLSEEAYQVYLEANGEGETGLEHIVSDGDETVSSDYESDSFSVYAEETGHGDEYQEDEGHTHEHDHTDEEEEHDTDLDDVDEALEDRNEDMETVESELENEGYETEEESYTASQGAGAGGAFGAIGAAVYTLALL